jgi:hypothetical protein
MRRIIVLLMVVALMITVAPIDFAKVEWNRRAGSRRASRTSPLHVLKPREGNRPPCSSLNTLPVFAQGQPASP